jgi:hypothetical protein
MIETFGWKLEDNLVMAGSLMIETFGWKLEDNLVMAVYLLLRKMPSNRNW